MLTDFKSDIDSRTNAILDFKNKPITHTKRNLIFVGGSMVGLLLLGSIIMQVIAGVTALVVAGGAMLGSVYLYRVIKANDAHIQKVIRRKAYQRMVREAREYAIEHLELEVQNKSDKISDQKKSLVKIKEVLAKMKSSLMKSTNESVIQQQKEMVAKVQGIVERKEDNLRQASDSLNEFRQEVANYQQLDQMANLLQEAIDLSQDDDEEIKNLLTLKAFESIEDNFNNAFTQLEVEELEGVV